MVAPTVELARFTISNEKGQTEVVKVLVTGGTGTLGREFVRTATRSGHTVRILSRQARPKNQKSEIEWAQGDLASGEGLPEAVSGVDTVVHAATSPGFGSERVDVEGTRRLVSASEKAGVAHFLYPSIVGVDEIPLSYYRRKRTAERIVAEGKIPHTILRVTQFHPFVDQIISAAVRLPLVALLPTDVQIQSVATSEVAAHLSQQVGRGANGRLPDFCGPEVNRLGELAHVWMEVRGTRRRLVRLPLPGRTARAFREGKATNPTRREGSITWREWLEREEGTGA